MFFRVFDLLSNVGSSIGLSRPNQHTHYYSKYARTHPGIFDPPDHGESHIGLACPGQSTRHLTQHSRMFIGSSNPSGHIHHVLSNPPRHIGLARLGQSTRHPRQSLRTKPWVFDPLSNVNSSISLTLPD